MATVKQVVSRAYHDYLQKGLGNHSDRKTTRLSSDLIKYDQTGQIPYKETAKK